MIEVYMCGEGRKAVEVQKVRVVLGNRQTRVKLLHDWEGRQAGNNEKGKKCSRRKI